MDVPEEPLTGSTASRSDYDNAESVGQKVGVVVSAIAEACRSHDWLEDWERLSAPQRAVCVTDLLMGEVYNGGLVQFYENSSGNAAIHVPWALRTVGADAIADVLEEANALFQADALTDRAARGAAVNEQIEEQLDRLTDVLYELEDAGFDIWALLLDYIEKQPETFFD